MDTLRIVSLNTWKCDGVYTRRLQAMKAGLQALHPDVVLLQEVFASDDGQYDTARDVAQALSMQCIRAPSRHKVRWMDGQQFASTCGLAILSRFPIMESSTYDLPTASEDGDRIVQCAKLSVAGTVLWVVNLHLTHLVEANALREHQVKHIVHLLSSNKMDSAVVMGGDFNATIASRELKALLVPSLGLVNCFEGKSKFTHCNTQGQQVDIDHLFMRPANTWRVESARTAFSVSADKDSDAPSDHMALVLDLKKLV
jgi:endonuclease/exonuclease/phosphatase family metal-dependent hydrolase